MKIAHLMALFILCISSSSTERKSKVIPREYVYIPGGEVYIPLNPGKKNKFYCQPFYISSTEVSNEQYRIFLADLKRQDRMAEYFRFLPDTNVWRRGIRSSEPQAKYYFRHPAYNNYPVVGVTKKGAAAYCKWLTERCRQEDPEFKLTFKLPYKKQWIRAARGNGNEVYTHGQKLYDKKGNVPYNYKEIGDEHISFNVDSGRYVVVCYECDFNTGNTTVINANSPNRYGLFNMCGNVAEVIEDGNVAMGGNWNSSGFDIRIESEQAFNFPSKLVGFRPVLE